VLVKHSNPCGLACAPTVEEAFRDAYTCDPVSAFGGILAVNRPFTLALAQAIVDAKLFLEIIVAPDFERGVLQRFAKRTDLRLLKLDEGSVVSAGTTWDLRGVQGGLLLQSRDSKGFSVTDAKVVTERKPTPEELAGLVFAFRAVKCVKSNGIVLTQGLKTVGIGAGQTSRVDSVRVAVQKAGERAAGAFLGSDAFFPFPDGVEEAARAGVRAVIQPGGSKQDPAVIEAANRLDLCMVLTGQRHFRH
jgi:phosphoribosylaminoimidazolecarboxamide formyltransferase/IMP cyclohydrolase